MRYHESMFRKAQDNNNNNNYFFLVNLPNLRPLGKNIDMRTKKEENERPLTHKAMPHKYHHQNFKR